jgi:hypothetical protein
MCMCGARNVAHMVARTMRSARDAAVDCTRVGTLERHIEIATKQRRERESNTVQVSRTLSSVERRQNGDASCSVAVAGVFLRSALSSLADRVG